GRSFLDRLAHCRSLCAEHGNFGIAVALQAVDEWLASQAAAFLARQRLGVADAEGGEPGAVQAAPEKIIAHRLRALLGELLVVLPWAHAIGVADDVDLL